MKDLANDWRRMERPVQIVEQVERETNHVHVIRFDLISMEEEGNGRKEEGGTLLENPPRSGWNGTQRHCAVLRIPPVPRGEEEENDENGDAYTDQADGDALRDGTVEEVRHAQFALEVNGIVSN